MGTISVNGKTYSGNSVSVVNGNVFVDGKKAEPSKQPIVSIIIEGQVDKLSVDSCDSLIAKGNVGSLKTMSGDIECGNVLGNVKTMSGDVRCEDIHGDVSSVSGDIKNRKKQN